MIEKREYMDNLNIENQHSDYNKVPVFYCKKCLSLKIRNIPSMEDSDYCDECGSTDIAESSIEDWEELYKSKHGHKYLDEY